MADWTDARIVERVREVLRAEANAVEAMAALVSEDTALVARMLLSCKGHILVTGAGTSHAMALRFAHLLSCSGTPALCLNAGDCLHGGSGAITANDVLFIISKGGTSDEINRLVAIARERGAQIIAQTENRESPLAQMSDALYYVHARGNVDPFGMIATGSSLVNGAADDALCVLLQEMRGYTQEAFGKTHPGGAVGLKVKALTKEEGQG